MQTQCLEMSGCGFSDLNRGKDKCPSMSGTVPCTNHLAQIASNVPLEMLCQDQTETEIGRVMRVCFVPRRLSFFPSVSKR